MTFEELQERAEKVFYSFWIEEETPKMYMGEIDKKTGDNIADFLAWAAEHVAYPEEVPNDSESIGLFVKKYMGKPCDKIPFMFVEDHNGNIIEWYVFTDSDNLRHEKVAL